MRTCKCYHFIPKKRFPPRAAPHIALPPTCSTRFECAFPLLFFFGGSFQSAGFRAPPRMSCPFHNCYDLLESLRLLNPHCRTPIPFSLCRSPIFTHCRPYVSLSFYPRTFAPITVSRLTLRTFTLSCSSHSPTCPVPAPPLCQPTALASACSHLYLSFYFSHTHTLDNITTRQHDTKKRKRQVSTHSWRTPSIPPPSSLFLYAGGKEKTRCAESIVSRMPRSDTPHVCVATASVITRQPEATRAIHTFHPTSSSRLCASH